MPLVPPTQAGGDISNTPGVDRGTSAHQHHLRYPVHSAMIVAIASGKGGTGKTTVATSLALSLVAETADPPIEAVAAAPILLDCDVEAPNSGLFLDLLIEGTEEIPIAIPVVDPATCTYCGICADVCAWNALSVLPEEVLVFPDLCHGCGSCTLICPENAISEGKRRIGALEWGRADGLVFGRGILDTGQALAVPVIKRLKERHPAGADSPVVILDAPPGTSCPLVETLRGADYALLVTEPTPFGLHDLRLAVEVARDELEIPVGVVVNRDGIGDSGVDEYCSRERIPVLMRIPLDRRIARALSEGRALVDALPEYRPLFLELWRRIREEAGR